MTTSHAPLCDIEEIIRVILSLVKFMPQLQEDSDRANLYRNAQKGKVTDY